MFKQNLTEDDYKRAASVLGVEVAALKAVVAVESSGSGFLSDGRPVILFEAHHFSTFTGGKYNRTHPGISSNSWDRSLYKRGVAEYDRLQEAMDLDEGAALKSASWGLFQIMGFNFPLAGYVDVESFVGAMYDSEAKHLDAFVSYIMGRRLQNYLLQKDWDGFDLHYNGPGYKQNRYDEKLARYYEEFIRG